MKRYDAYKKTDSHWFDEAPFHWISGRIKDFVDIKASTKVPTNLAADDLIEFLPMTNVNEELGKIKQFNLVHLKEVSSGYTKFRNRDVIFAKITPCMENGNCAIVHGLTYGISFGSTEFMVFRPLRKLTEKYLHYSLHNELFRKNAEPFMKGTAGQKRISSHYMATHYFALPPLPEQKAIANYLDTKTAQIDRKIDLLTQKATQYGKLKQSLINETVTRGLDKCVAMKDSGVEWLGDVPEHWEIKRIKEVSIVVNGATPKSNVAENWGGELSWVTADDLGKLNTKFIADTKRKITEKGYASCGTTICPVGSVVISGRAPIGHIGILSIKASSNQGCKTLVLNHKVVNNFYIYYSLLSSKSKLEALGRGTTFIELSTKEFGLFNLPMPSLLEQQVIADYLDTKTGHIDHIVETINTQIDKLKELRKTLINDIVTGKIKVVK